LKEEKKKILRVRPFNMANFSGGSSFVALFAMYGLFLSFPATLLLWIGMAVPLKAEDGTLNYRILRRRLHLILLPICVVLFAVWFYFLTEIPPYGPGSTHSYNTIALVWTTAFTTIGIYCSIFFSAMLLNSKGKLTKNKWFFLSLAFAVLMIITGFIGMSGI